MDEEYVKKEEFENLKNQVEKLEQKISESAETLNEISRKIDIIYEKIETVNEVRDLKLSPIQEKIAKLEQNQDWLWKTIGATLIGIAIKIILEIKR